MRILLLSQYFWPESFIVNDIARTLKEQGHDVVVATGKPNYPEGKVFEGYQAWGCMREEYLEGIEVVRVPLWPRGEGGAKNLVLNYLSFVLSGLVFFPWLLRKRQFDSILVFAPSPITQVIPAIWLKWLKRAKLAVWVQDLWPESLSATGFIKKPWMLKAVGVMVKGIYACCDKLLVQSMAFVEPVAKYARRDKIEYYPNSIDSTKALSAEPIPEALIALLEGHFCVVFAGNLGTAQSLEALVQTARLLLPETDIRLVLVGSGSRLAWLESQKQAYGLTNLILPGRFPSEAMPQIFERAGALLVSLNNDPAFAQTVPSKVQAYLAAGRPILASMNGEGARVVLEAGAGLASPAEEVLPLAANIRALQAMEASQRAAMGEAGRAYFDQHFEMIEQVKRLVEMLK